MLLIAILGYSTYMDNVYNNTQEYQDINPENNVRLEVSYTGPYNLDEIIHEIKTRDNNKEYNNDTLSWVESLKEKNVFISNNTYVIMNDEDANKIRHNKTIDITDVYIVENIE